MDLETLNKRKICGKRKEAIYSDDFLLVSDLSAFFQDGLDFFLQL